MNQAIKEQVKQITEEMKRPVPAKEMERQFNGQSFGTEEALAILLKERESREVRCLNEIDEVLKKHNCRLDVGILLKAGQVIPQLTVVSN